MYRLCTFLAGELEKLRNKRKFAISVFVVSEFYCTYCIIQVHEGTYVQYAEVLFTKIILFGCFYMCRTWSSKFTVSIPKVIANQIKLQTV